MADSTKKPGAGLISFIQANEALAQGMANAVQEGYAALDAAVSDSGADLTEPGFENPLIKGSLAGWILAVDATVTGLRNAALALFPGSSVLAQVAGKFAQDAAEATKDEKGKKKGKDHK